MSMHGLIHVELEAFLKERLGAEAWAESMVACGLAGRIYLPGGRFPDEEASALLHAAARTLATTVMDVQRQFGMRLAPVLMTRYAEHIDPAWRTLDVVERAEDLIHAVVRGSTADAAPPTLQSARHPAGLTVWYDSRRRMCGLAEGLVIGIARHLGEDVTVHQPVCMERGAPVCEIEVRLVATPQA